MNTLATSLTLCPRTNAAQWNRLVDGSPTPDIYYRPEYVLASLSGEQSATAVVVTASTMRFLVPLALRPLATLEFTEGMAGFDAITPYGYGGVLPLEGGEISLSDAQELLASLREWCIEAGVVSCLLRLHPLTAQHEWLADATGDGVTLQLHGETKAIDLSNWDEARQVPLGLARGRRSDLNCARRELRASVISGGAKEIESALQAFRAIYNQTMERREASEFYFFPNEYYCALARGLGDNLSVALCYHGDEPVGGALFFADTLFAHYHLSGTTDVGRKFKANTMAVIAGSDWARQRGCRWLFLGGGVQPGDSLFRFKDSFGATTFHYGFVKFVADHKRYAQLVEMRRSCVGLDPMRAGFFPEYRA